MKLSLLCGGAFVVAVIAPQACEQSDDCAPNVCDAATDAPPRPDAAGDAVGDVVQPPIDWVRPAWVPETCQIFQPANQTAWASIAPVNWGPCGVSLPVAACEQIDLDWTNDPSVAQVGAKPRTFNNTDELAIQRSWDDHTEIQITNMSSGNIYGLWIEPYTDACVMAVSENVTGSAALEVMTRTGPTSESILEYLGIIADDARALSNRTLPDYQFPQKGINGVVEATPATDNIMGVFVGAAMTQYVLDRVNSKIINLGDAFTINPQAVGDRLWWAGAQSDRDVMMTWTHAEGATVFYDPGAGVSVHDIATDGNWLSWIESSNPDGQGGFSTSSLYVSPYVTDPKLLVKTKVRDGICSAPLCGANLSNGFLITSVTSSPTQSGILIVRMSDLAQWYFPPPPKPHVLHVGWRGAQYFYMPLDKTVIRFPVTGLGAPVSD